MERLILNDMIKALRCVASQDAVGDCYADHENFIHMDDEHKRIVCGTGEDLRDYISGKEAVGCPYHQKTYGTCYEDGKLHWLKDVAELLEELKSYKEAEEQGLLVRLPCKEAYGGECTYEVRMTAIDASEKQIPKEPKYKKQLRDFFGVATVVKGDCPCCGKAEIYSNANYCPDCGQKLDWREEE